MDFLSHIGTFQFDSKMSMYLLMDFIQNFIFFIKFSTSRVKKVFDFILPFWKLLPKFDMNLNTTFFKGLFLINYFCSTLHASFMHNLNSVECKNTVSERPEVTKLLLLPTKKKQISSERNQISSAYHLCKNEYRIRFKMATNFFLHTVKVT